MSPPPAPSVNGRGGKEVEGGRRKRRWEGTGEEEEEREVQLLFFVFCVKTRKRVAPLSVAAAPVASADERDRKGSWRGGGGVRQE